MTKDFRHIGRRSPDRPAAEDATSPTPIPMAPPDHRLLVLRVVAFFALALFAAGLWLLTGGASPLPRETAYFIGIALVVSAIADIGVVFILKRIWSKPR
jgi:hypothetical protein